MLISINSVKEVHYANAKFKLMFNYQSLIDSSVTNTVSDISWDSLSVRVNQHGSGFTFRNYKRTTHFLSVTQYLKLLITFYYNFLHHVSHINNARIQKMEKWMKKVFA